MSNRVWSPYVLGILSTESEYYPKKNIFVNSNQDLQFSVKILSSPPHSFPNSQKEVTCYGSDLESHGFEDEFFDSEQRKNSLQHFLEDNLLVFQVEKKSTSTDDFFRTRNIDLVLKKTSFREDMSFFPVPLYTEQNEKKSLQDFTKDEFTKQMIEGKFIGRNEFVSQEPDDTPRFVIYKTKEGEYIAFGEFESHQYAHGGFSFTTAESSVKQVTLPEELVNDLYIFREVAYISLDTEDAIINLFNKAEFLQPVLSEAKHVTVLTKPVKNPSTDTERPDESSNNMEEAFFEQFIAETRKMSLNYGAEDLYNFHTAVKAGGLIILSGMSGTGKSQLVNAYQKALNLDSDKFLMIPVSPTWADDSDLTGYPDIINNVYRAADTGLVKLLIEARKNPTKTFMVCFDEMNLAKVEHYFSQFLSVLEMEKGRRWLRLYNSDLQNKFYNGVDYTPEVLIGDNVIFVGTVNFDESTHHFSDKVLDRSNLIQLKVEPFINLLVEHEKATEKNDLIKGTYNVQEFVQQEKRISLNQKELELLWELHLLLNKVSADMGIGPRVVKHIDKYVKNLSSLPDCPISRGDAIDIQLVQRVLPKLRGSEDIMKTLIGTYEPESDKSINSTIIEVLDKHKDIATFSRTREKLLNKAKELFRHGYTV